MNFQPVQFHLLSFPHTPGGENQPNHAVDLARESSETGRRHDLAHVVEPDAGDFLLFRSGAECGDTSVKVRPGRPIV